MDEKAIHKSATTAILQGVWTRFENSVSTGIFDANVAAYGREHWVEYKVQHGNLIHVRGSQYRWGIQRLRVGLHNLWFLTMKSRGVSHPTLYTAHGVLMLCDPKKTDKKGQMIINLSTLHPTAIGWRDIEKRLFSA